MELIFRAGLVISLLGLAACGLPTNQLSQSERRADMEWAFTIFKHNYAPADLKKSSFGVDMSLVEADCVTQAQNDMSNPEFLALFQKCIHSFKDAHVGAQQMNNGLLPEYAQVAHLGFTTMRTKANIKGSKVNALRIVSQLKGSDSPSAPLIPGDLIVGVNGMKVGDYLKQEIIPYINVGQDETNLTVAAFRFGVRTSIDMALPAEEDVKLTVVRQGSTFDITMPWITQDLLAFQTAQAPPPEENQPATPNPHGEMVVQNPLAESFFGYKELAKLFEGLDNPVEMVTERLKFIALTGFRMAKFNPVMQSLFSGAFDNGKIAEALINRTLPLSETVVDLMIDPLFTAKAVTTDQGVTYAYIQIKNFPAEDKILTEWHRAITAIEDKGIKSVIIDMVDNGGGSLVHGMRMLNMLRKDQLLQYPSMQVRLNNNWMNSFKTQAAFGVDDYAKTIARRVVEKLEQDKAQGKKLSRPFSVTVLDPFFTQNPGFGLSSDVKIALMVNEICVSMCDIFASVFQDNNIGEVIGQRTMGGGGNVTQHGLSPVSKMGMALTESLILSPKGVYLEDNGVTPDVKIDMVADREKGFAEAFQAAYDSVTAGLPKPQPPTTPAP